jgi:hypothetical protein
MMMGAVGNEMSRTDPPVHTMGRIAPLSTCVGLLDARISVESPE